VLFSRDISKSVQGTVGMGNDRILAKMGFQLKRSCALGYPQKGEFAQSKKMTPHERRAIRARRAALDGAVSVLKKHPRFPAAQVQILARSKELMDGLTEQEKQWATSARIAVVLRQLDVRAEAYLDLVDDMKSQEAFMTVLNNLGIQAWGEYTGYDPELVQPIAGDPQVDAIRQRVAHWVGEGYKRLMNQESKPPSDETQLRPESGGPTVFVSYSWDSPDHKAWVLRLANRLTANGIKVVIDQKDLKLGARTPAFMERSVSECDRVLVICTETYKQRFDDRNGGAGYEGHIITGEIINQVGENKFIPVLRCGDWKTAMPTALSGVYGVDLRSDLSEEYAKLIDELGGMSATGSHHTEEVAAKAGEDSAPSSGSSRRERGEELYQVAQGFFDALTTHYLPYLRVMAGELTYNEALDITISRGESPNFHRMEFLVQVDFPELLQEFNRILGARDSANEVMSAHKAAYKVGDTDGHRYIAPMKKALEAIERSAAAFKLRLIGTLRGR
jgi:hypothetical protein